jgi:RNA polymerase sigma-70 factor (ECF subfamily)
VRVELAIPTEVPPTDAELVARHRGGDRAAFDEIVTRHRQAVYRTARAVLGRHEDADEASQLTFVRAWRALDGFRGDAALRTWLVRIAINVSRSLHAAASAGRRDEGREPHELPEPAEDPDARLGRLELGRQVREAVAGLPPRQREVVSLKIWSEMTYREVAGAMGLSEGAVKAHLHQAVANLRRRMAGRGGRGGDDG